MGTVRLRSGAGTVIADEVILWVHAVGTLYMVGLIWFVQVVHYPLMHRVGAGVFSQYAQTHQLLTTRVVAPAMLLEAGTMAWLVLRTPDGVDVTGVRIGAALLSLIWLSTACLQVPCHRRLSAGYDAFVLRRLVRTNWIRTLAWTARGWLVIDLLRTFALARL